MLDSAGYGAVTIAQSVSIIAPPGVYAGITASSGDGVTVNGAGIVVVLQGLTINGLGTGSNGINFSAGDELHVINGSISNFASSGIYATVTAGRSLRIRHDHSWELLWRKHGVGRNHHRIGARTRGGIDERRRLVWDLGHQWQRAVGPRKRRLEQWLWRRWYCEWSRDRASHGHDTLISDNNTGVRVENSFGGAGSVATLDVIRSTLTRNKFNGAVLTSSGASAVMIVVSSVVTENAVHGIHTSGSNTTAFVSGNTIAGNIGGGIFNDVAGVVHTRSNNAGEQSVPTIGTVTPVPGF